MTDFAKMPHSEDGEFVKARFAKLTQLSPGGPVAIILKVTIDSRDYQVWIDVDKVPKNADISARNQRDIRQFFKNVWQMEGDEDGK